MKTCARIVTAVTAVVLLAIVNAGCATTHQPEVKDTWTESANRSAQAASRAEEAARRAEAAAARVDAAAQKIENIANHYDSDLQKSLNK